MADGSHSVEDGPQHSAETRADLMTVISWSMAAILFAAVAAFGFARSGGDSVVVALDRAPQPLSSTQNAPLDLNGIDTSRTGSTNAGSPQKPTAGVTTIAKNPPATESPLLSSKPIKENGFAGEVVQFVQSGAKPRATTAPTNEPKISKGAEIGIDLGGGASFAQLTKRYFELTGVAPDLFNAKGARGDIRETNTGLEARLVVGPFKSVKAAKKACQALRQKIETECFPADYSGQNL
ncbi:MAG: SPOR domain-containing protein [Pseudomonadota bacterium]